MAIPVTTRDDYVHSPLHPETMEITMTWRNHRISGAVAGTAHLHQQTRAAVRLLKNMIALLEADTPSPLQEGE